MKTWARSARLVAAGAFLATMVAYLFPFVESSPPYNFDSTRGIKLFFLGLVAPFFVPTGIVYFAAFSLPLIAAFFGLMYLRRDTFRGSLVGTVCAVMGSGGLVIGHIIDTADRWAFRGSPIEQASGCHSRPAIRPQP